MQLHLDPGSPIPIRLQLTEQLKHFIEGRGSPGGKALPSIRELADFLGINPNTVARAIGMPAAILRWPDGGRTPAPRPPAANPVKPGPAGRSSSARWGMPAGARAK